MTIRIHWLSAPEQLEQMAPVYRRFLRTVDDRAMFHEIERVKILWPLYRERIGEFAWLWAESDGEMVGLAPLQRERKSVLRGGVHVLRSYGKVGGALAQWYTDWLIPDRARVGEVLQAFRGALEGEFRREWDLLELNYLNPQDPVTREMRRSWPAECFEDDGAIASAIELGGDFDGYRKRLKSKFIADIQRERRKAARLWAEPSCEQSRTISPEQWGMIEKAHRDRQAHIRRQGEQRVPLFEEASRADGFLELMQWAENSGQTRHYWLKIEGALASYMLCIARGGTLFPQLTAFDERFASVSPTKLLLWELIGAEAEHGTQTIDFGVGINLFKRQFGTRFIQMVNMHWPNSNCVTARVRYRMLSAARKLRSRLA